MLLVVLFAVGFAVAFLVAALMRRRRSRALLGGAAVALAAVYAIYVGLFASCPQHGECDKWLGVVLVAVAAAGWIAGTAASWLVRRPSPPG
jgi:protein-S-isoprenylcysteine O-methyltransferase Ste14